MGAILSEILGILIGMELALIHMGSHDGGLGELFQVVLEEVGHPDGSALALPEEELQGLPSLGDAASAILHRSVAIGPMQEVQVQVINSQSPDRALKCSQGVFKSVITGPQFRGEKYFFSEQKEKERIQKEQSENSEKMWHES